jgi:hypothetical protein
LYEPKGRKLGHDALDRRRLKLFEVVKERLHFLPSEQRCRVAPHDAIERARQHRDRIDRDDAWFALAIFWSKPHAGQAMGRLDCGFAR